jgi:hypothetical protein
MIDSTLTTCIDTFFHSETVDSGGKLQDICEVNTSIDILKKEFLAMASAQSSSFII